jgi:hypothetical protein
VGVPRRRLLGAGASVALVAIAVVLLAIGGHDDGARAVETAPHLADRAALIELEDAVGHEIYWAGPPGPRGLELREEASGNVFVRYLPRGVAAGDPRPRFLTVGPYPVADAEDALQRAAAEAGQRVEELGGDAIALVNPDSAGSVYLVHPGSDLQIEVYDPAPRRAQALIRRGAIRPVGEG